MADVDSIIVEKRKWRETIDLIAIMVALQSMSGAQCRRRRVCSMMGLSSSDAR
jgi:hypothetical protein